MAVDRDRHHRAAAVRLRLPRPQGPYADAEGGGRVVRGLRGDCDPLRTGRVDPWWSVDGNGVLRRVCDGEGTLGRQPVRLPHHHDQLRGATSRPTEGAAVRNRVLHHCPDRVHIPGCRVDQHLLDRKSTRLNSNHTVISYAVFCLKKKKKKHKIQLFKKKKKKKK